MFKITSLTLYGTQESEVYTYKFDCGINYFKGKNDSGKTEFYTFIDYMLGSGVNLKNKDWYEGTLKCADLAFTYNDISFVLTRYLDNVNKNFIRYEDENDADELRLEEYKERLNLIFSQDQMALQDLRSFVGEDLTYRTFTLFNFLGENRQGILHDFFDKDSLIKYSLKLPAILNYIFNKNLARIEELKKEEQRLVEKLENTQKKITQNDELKNRINLQLDILGIKKIFVGSNADDILIAIDVFQEQLNKSDNVYKSRTIEELEAVYTSLDEQIKHQSNLEYDFTQFEIDETKQKKLLDELNDLLINVSGYDYLIQPLIELSNSLGKSISFNKYLIQNNTIKELKKQREKVKKELIAQQSRYKIYSVSDKKKAITLIKEYLGYYINDIDEASPKDLQQALKKIREEIRILQHSNDTEKIETLSCTITDLYKSSCEVSDLAEYDFSKEGFKISYLKNGNILQPQIIDDLENEGFKNYYTGSMARHTLIQLCGYLAFLKLLIKENRYPLIPILVIDHISKPFDEKNQKAIGKVLHGIYNDLDIDELQVFVFDDQEPSSLCITPNTFKNLVEERKSGFNPFYFKEI